jgi:hypothetical protein
MGMSEVKGHGLVDGLGTTFLGRSRCLLLADSRRRRSEKCGSSCASLIIVERARPFAISFMQTGLFAASV